MIGMQQVELTRQGRPVPKRKVEKVRELLELIKKFKAVGITKIEGIGAAQLQKLRFALRDKAIIKVSKNTFIKMALRRAEQFKQGISKLADEVRGQTALILTNENPVKLNLFLEKNKMRAPAKAGQIAPNDIIVPAGNTGIPPGPVISELSELGIPTRVESGTIWVTKDTVVVKAGERISRKVAIILSRLGIEPITVGLTMHAAYDDGIILKGEDLLPNIDKFKEMISQAEQEALNLALNAALPISEIMPALLQKAHMEAYSLALSVALPVPEVLQQLFAKADMEARSLALKIKERNPELIPEEIAVEAPSPVEEVKREKEIKEEEVKEEEEKKEEEEITGLGALFG